MQDAEEVEPRNANDDAVSAANSFGNETSCGQQDEILHGLNNVLVSILLNAQLIEWKLPSYSHLRRNVHEIERSAQRAVVLLKRLLSEGRAEEDPQNSVLDKTESQNKRWIAKQK